MCRRRLAAAALAVTLTASSPSVFERPDPAVPATRIDEHVFAHWKQLGIEPAAPSSDAVFLRRAYLDTIGTFPTAQEARAFRADPSPAKRAALIDALLSERQPDPRRFVERPAPNSKQATRSQPLGTLPAVPFEVVQ
jgi:hypothetical protein